MKETNHDYQNCLCGNYYDGKMNGSYNSWNEFKETWLGFLTNGYDDTWHFVFRYDIHKQEDENYRLELCCMLQRKGIYVSINIYNIDQKTLDMEVSEWLIGRKQYIDNLWNLENEVR